MTSWSEPLRMMAQTPLDPVDQALRERFGLEALRPWQREAIDALLGEPGRVLVVAPTGGGKSLCYQLPATLLPGTTIVVSPLIALMEDQVRALEARRIPATYLASTLSWEERSERLRGVRAGRFEIVYVAPERLGADGFAELLERMQPPMLVVDEAHCIVQWGHDFRPDYLRIGDIIERLRPRRLLACTATATHAARVEILARLGLDESSARVVLRGFARPNLALDVVEVDRPRDAVEATRAALAESIGTGRAPRGAAIVYAATRKSTEKIAAELVRRGFGARAYHAGMAPEERAEVQRAFSDRSLAVVVATNAFGMGIDRSDVRLVAHAQPPASIEAYYQEVGRAGRDGEPARGLLAVAPSDIAVRRRLCEMGSDGAPADPAQAARAWGLFRELLRYVDARSCRHDFILRYFGDEAESLGGCGRCDVCRDLELAAREDPVELERESIVVRQALAAVARARRRGGMQAIAEMLRGERRERVTRFGFDELSTFGLLPGRAQTEVMAILRALLAAGWIDLTAGDYPVPYLTEPGGRVMRGEEPARLRLPRVRSAPKASRSRGATGKGRAASPEPLPAADGALLEALKLHRSNVATEAGVPAYVVAHDRTLAEIAARRPLTVDDLVGVHGMGPAKIARYGAGLVGVVRRMAGEGEKTS